MATAINDTFSFIGMHEKAIRRPFKDLLIGGLVFSGHHNFCVIRHCASNGDVEDGGHMFTYLFVRQSHLNYEVHDISAKALAVFRASSWIERHLCLTRAAAVAIVPVPHGPSLDPPARKLQVENDVAHTNGHPHF